MYEVIERLGQLYELLEDDLSRELFKARLLLAVEPTMSNAMGVLCLNESIRQDPVEKVRRLAWKENVKKITGGGQKLFLYGAGLVGSVFTEHLQCEGLDFYGYCDRRAADFPDGLRGKPVYPPEYLFQHSEECYVIIAVGDTGVDSVWRTLEENHFPKDHVLRYFDAPLMDKQYFDFPTLYRRGTAFVDAGCFDCSTDIAFANWCDGEYSKIFAFEPDSQSYAVCQEKGKNLPGLVLIQAGVADHSGTAGFLAKGSGASSLCTSSEEDLAEQTETVQLTTIDEAVGGETVGMIKMDIEGAEYSALLGAEKTIRRDKPLMALCVYHRPGDTVAFMDYLNKLVPEYRFWLRQYAGPAAYETVLYASVDML